MMLAMLACAGSNPVAPMQAMQIAATSFISCATQAGCRCITCSMAGILSKCWCRCRCREMSSWLGQTRERRRSHTRGASASAGLMLMGKADAEQLTLRLRAEAEAACDSMNPADLDAGACELLEGSGASLPNSAANSCVLAPYPHACAALARALVASWLVAIGGETAKLEPQISSNTS